MAAFKGKTGKAGMPGLVSKSKLCKQRGLQKKPSSVQEDFTPDNTKWVARDDHEVNLYRDISLVQNPSFKGI